MRRRIGLLAVLAMVVAAMPAFTGPVAATTHDQVDVTVFADEHHTEIVVALLSPDLASGTFFHGRVNADDAGAGGTDVQDTESATFFFDDQEPMSPVEVVEIGTASDRWTEGQARLEGSQIIIDISAGDDPLLCGDPLGQLYLSIEDGANPPVEIDLRGISAQPCPVVADLEPVVSDSAYLFDSSGDRFHFVGASVDYQPGIVNEGPDDEPDTRFDFRIGYFGVADDPSVDDEPELGVNFDWTLENPCFLFGISTIAPTAICDLGALAAGDTITKSVAVDWLSEGDYFTAVIVYDQVFETIDPDDSSSPQFLTYRVRILDPVEDLDGDGIANGIDRSGTSWDPLTSSSSFDDSYWGGTTSGTIIDGEVSVTDHPTSGVTVSAATAATVDACGQTLELTSGTVATITCGSITILVDSGQVEVTLGDGSTLTLDAADEATVDEGEVTVLSGSATITPDGGEPVTVEAGDTYVVGGDADSDGILDAEDVCSDTMAETLGTFDLKPNRYYLDSSGSFVDGDGEAVLDDYGTPITVGATGGCSATQIIDEAELGKGLDRFGITRSALLDWIAGLSI